MKWVIRTAFLGLIVYSVALVTFELRYSQAYVRHFVTDIEGPVRLYAINTTICAFMLWSSALLFAICLVSSDRLPETRPVRGFYISQILLFAYLGIDDRFGIHEWLQEEVGINDFFVFLGLAITEVALLLWLGRFRHWPKHLRCYIYAAAGFLLAMLTIDEFVPRDLVPRLSLEDLSKTWATVFIFLYAWHTCCDRIRALKEQESLRTPPQT